MLRQPRRTRLPRSEAIHTRMMPPVACPVTRAPAAPWCFAAGCSRTGCCAWPLVSGPRSALGRQEVVGQAARTLLVRASVLRAFARGLGLCLTRSNTTARLQASIRKNRMVRSATVPCHCDVELAIGRQQQGMAIGIRRAIGLIMHPPGPRPRGGSHAPHRPPGAPKSLTPRLEAQPFHLSVQLLHHCPPV